jgi:hypothetical protein
MPTETDLLPLVAKLEAIVASYKVHERNDPDAPPKHGGFWSYRRGHLQVVTQTTTFTEFGTARHLHVGVQIGSKFGEPLGESTEATRAQRRALVGRLVDELKGAMEEFRAVHGGYVELFDGSAYGTLGWY